MRRDAHHHLPAPVLPARQAWPLHGIAATRAVEALWLRREANGALMQRAGRSVARWIAALAPHARHIWVACGPGGNGGDGLHAAALLAQQGRHVCVSLHANPTALPRDAAQGLEAAREAGVEIHTAAPEQPFDVAVDALLGIGARPEPQGAVLEGVRAIGNCAARRMAIDLPTGLHPETGATSHQGQVQVEATLALLTLRPGLFTAGGRDACGQIWFDSLGAEQDSLWSASATARLIHEQEHPACWVQRPHDSHKGRFGDVHVIGGAPGMSGAARLAAYAALSAGAGRTLITLLDPAGPAHDTAHPEWIWHPLAALNSPGALERATLVCGCGAGMALDERLASWLERAPRLVLDADALNAIARDRALGDALQARSPRGQHSILTPHPLEAARLLGVNTSAVQSDRVACAYRLAETFGTTVVLKGSGTVIATPGETTAINATGGPALASGGSGDVLAGWIGGLWAQAHSIHEDLGGSAVAHKVACSAAWLHGHAADLQRPRATLTATELVQAMRSVPTPSGIASAH